MSEPPTRVNLTRQFWHASLRIAGIVASLELLLMFLLEWAQVNALVENFLDMGILTAASTPLIYLWVIKPLQRSVQSSARQLMERNEELARTLAELRCLQEAIDQHAIVEVSAPNGKLISANDKFSQISGYSREELLGKDHNLLNSGVHPRQMFINLWRTISANRIWRGKICNRARDGSHFWVDTTIVPFRDHHGRITKYVAIRSDITELKRIEQRLRESEERYALAERGANDGLWDWDLLTNEVYFSPRAKSLLGYEPQMVLNSPDSWFSRVDERHIMQFQADLTLHLAGQTQKFQNEHTILAPGQPSIWLLCRGVAVRDEQGKAIRIAGSLTDITRQKEAEDRLRQAAQTDRLTGLPNRTMIHERVSAAIRRHRANPNRHFALLFLDFDRFKIVNDSLGHKAGDQLLQGIAERLKRSLRTSDTIGSAASPIGLAGRLGGDEFVVLLEDLKQVQDATIVAERLLKLFAESHHIDGQEVVSTASIGITTSQAGHEQAEDVIRDADTAMYRAKTTGKARFVIFDQKMHEEATAKLKLESDLRRGIDNGQLRVFYQPLLRLDTGQAYGFEALVRWQHPERGMISPADFIPIAEETGLIVPLGQWVMRESFQQLMRWQEQFADLRQLRMNINLSRRQIHQPDLIQRVSELVAETQIDPACIQLEITESMVMQDAQAAIALLVELGKIGVKLVMDDFGTGYSSLSCLHRFPIHGLKIDRSFVANMAERHNCAAVIHAIITLAHNLNISVTAEGIEQPAELVQLQALDCDYGQGYHFAKPMDAAAAERYLNDRLSLAQSA